MRKAALLLLIASGYLITAAQLDSRKEIKIPDIPGYLTLKCDFHMHTIFSDGYVWPTIRVDEAWREGLDAFAISDHIEYHPFKDDVPVNLGRAYEIAKPRADRYGLIIIRAGEITRQMPPGHFNCLFLEDVAELDKPDFWDAIAAAESQGAFIMWNHPGWQQQNEIPLWYDEHTRLFEKGLMHGMEIVNERSYYPLAHQWCVERNITMLGNSDVHNPIGMDYDISMGDKRVITLVFAKKQSEEAIKEALFEGKTAVYAGDKLIGKEEFLKPIFYESVKLPEKKYEVKAGNALYLQIINTSEILFELMAGQAYGTFSYPEEIILYPERTVMIRISFDKQTPPGVQHIKIPYTAKNLLIDSAKGLPVNIEFEVKVTE